MKIAIRGGGIGGTTAALKLLERYGDAIEIDLFEKRDDILRGPPFCHLHLGGMLYPDLPFEECKSLFDHSFEFMKEFPESLLIRPTVVCYRKESEYIPQELILKCHLIHNLGAIDDYFAVYTRQDFDHFKLSGKVPFKSEFHDPFVQEFMKIISPDTIKFPVVSVREYGIDMNIVRETLKSKLKHFPNFHLHLNTISSGDSEYDLVVNATGANNPRGPAFYEMKASWIVKLDETAYTEISDDNKIAVPEIAVIGERNTPFGMVQISPMGKSLFQIHSMTKECTLFGCETSLNAFDANLKKFIENDSIDESVIESRIQQAIIDVNKISSLQFSKIIGQNCLWGVQRIEGNDTTKRASDIVYRKKKIVEIVIVKGISAVYAANLLCEQINIH